MVEPHSGIISAIFQVFNFFLICTAIVAEKVDRPVIRFADILIFIFTDKNPYKCYQTFQI